MGFDTMTPVQASTIPMFARNKDVVVDSVTGSGKTLAFVIPILEKIIQEEINTPNLKKGHFYSLILAPTRELSNQIQSVINSFLDHYPENSYPIRSQLLVGTDVKSVRDDINNFLENRPQILVGTPGRVYDFLNASSVKTHSCGMVVLDEADRLLDGSFLGDIEKILNSLPKQRRTGLFSATIGSAGNSIFKTGLRNPVKITVNSKQSAPKSLNINYAVVKPELKLQYLLSLINNYRFKKCIVYFPTCTSVNHFYNFIKFLQKKNIVEEDLSFFSLHGKLQTSSRAKTLESFTESITNSVLLTTDVAARGIDIAGVDLVIQLDPPTDSDIFLHRCGRTGRANQIGKAITFLNEGREEDFVGFMEVKNVEMEEIELKIDEKRIPSNFYEIFTKYILEDRARFDLAVRSFVGFIRNYSKHGASSIFRLQTLDYVGLCKLYGLFRLPKMPEITKYLRNTESEVNKDGWIVNPPPIDMDKFAYTDNKREKKRLDELKNLKNIQDKNKLKSELKKKNMAWSNNTMTKEAKLERRTKMALKRKAIEAQLEKEGDDNSDDSDNDTQDDWKELILQKKRKKESSSGMQGSFDDL